MSYISVVTVNKDDGTEVEYKPNPLALTTQVINGAKALHPNWTSLVIVVLRDDREEEKVKI